MADANKTEQATPKRRQKAREQGQVARSRELPGVLALAAMLAALTVIAPSALLHWTVFYRNVLTLASTSDLDASGPMLFWPAVEVMRWLVPVLLAAMVVALLAGVMQGGINFAPEALALKFERLNPSARLGQIFSPLGLSQLLKSLLPFAAMLWIIANAMQSHWGEMSHASNLGLRPFTALVGGTIFEIVWKSGLVLLVWSVVARGTQGDRRQSRDPVARAAVAARHAQDALAEGGGHGQRDCHEPDPLRCCASL